MINPSKHIRLAVINACAPVPVWDEGVPKNTPTPKTYGLITSMSMQETARAKGCYEWVIGFDLNFYNINSLGYYGNAVLEDIIADIVPKIKNLTSPIVRIKNVDLEFMNTLSFNTSTNSIDRKVLQYTVWCDYQEEVTT